MIQRFKLGNVIATRGVMDALLSDGSSIDRVRGILTEAVARHVQGDWGNICEYDKQVNDEALVYGDRILSAYEVEGLTIWIITEADRSATTILFPDEY